MFGRRAFLRGFALWIPAGIAAAGALLQACAGSSDDGSGSSTCNTDGEVNWDIDDNHDHTVELTQAQVDAGAMVTLELTTGNGHTHMVDLTVADLDAIGAGDQVSVESTQGSGHTHLVTFNCTPSSGGGGGGGY